MKRYFLSCLFVILLLGCTDARQEPKANLAWVNLAHLNHLYEEIEIAGQDMAIIHIYSEYPDYGWVDANQEGIACVDDVARAAVVYLRHFELTGDVASLGRARKLLAFCCFMQADDGQFYNFIRADRSINSEGKTSLKSFGWWAARGLWALGEGYRVFLERDTHYAHILENHIRRSFAMIDTLLANYPQVDVADGFLAPRWLLYNSAADATSELMLGLSAYAEASGDTTVRGYLRKFGEGLLHMQLSRDDLPPGVHLSWGSVWHAWGNSQTQALARTGRLLHDASFLESAKLEAAQFYPYWVRENFPREMRFMRTTRNGNVSIEQTLQFDQIAYGMRPPIVGAILLHAITGDEVFAGMAAEIGAWFFGKNPLGTAMYDPATGRCFDGILSETDLNRNAGAESTIEALYAILEIEADPAAKAALANYIRTLK